MGVVLNMVSPKSLANLKAHQFKKGQKANPLGAGAHNKELKALRKLTVKEYREVIELALTSNLAALKALAADPETTALQAGIAVALGKAIQRGDWGVINSIAERLVGKLPDKLDVTGVAAAPATTVIFNIPDNGRNPKSGDS